MFCSTCSLSLVCCHQPVSNFFKVSLKLFKICYDVNFSCNADGYDSMDPNGNITIKWDILQANGGTEDVSFFFIENSFCKNGKSVFEGDACSNRGIGWILWDKIEVLSAFGDAF